FSVLRPRLPTPTLFPYTTLFRSGVPARVVLAVQPAHDARDVGLEQTGADHQEHQPADHADHSAGQRQADVAEHDDEAAPEHRPRSEEHTSELQSRENLVCRLLLE